MKRTPTLEEVDDKLHEIAYGPAKQPWPRSARITVWVLLALLLVLGVACMKYRHDLELLEIKDTEGHIIEEDPVIKTLPEGTTIRIWPSGRVEFVLPNAVMPLTVKEMKSM